MDWQAVAAIAAIAMVNLAGMRWLFDRRDASRQQNVQASNDNTARIFEIEKSMLRLRGDLPIEYVRREDWIRFGNTLEAKIDALRAELCNELHDVKDKLDVR